MDDSHSFLGLSSPSPSIPASPDSAQRALGGPDSTPAPPLTIIVAPDPARNTLSSIPLNNPPPSDPVSHTIVPPPASAPTVPSISQTNPSPVNQDIPTSAPMSLIPTTSPLTAFPGNRTGLGERNSTASLPMVNKNETKLPSGMIEKTSVTPTNSTSGSAHGKTESASESQGVSAGMIALVVLLLAFLGAIIGLFFWRRRRKSQAERRNAAAGMEEVVAVPPGDGKGDEKTMDGEKFGPDSSRSSGVDETENSNFGRKGIVRSSRPTSLCLNEASQQAKTKTNILAIPQTPSQQSHESSKQSHQVSPSNRPPGPRYDPGYAAHLRPTRPPNRPASWRSSIAVAWANLGIPTRLLEPSGRMSPGGGSIERGENGRPSPGSRNPFKGLYPGLSRAPSKPQNRVNGMTTLWNNERASQVITEEEEEDGSTIRSESDTASSTHHTESLKTSSTSGPPSSRKSVISTDPSTSASGDSSHSGTMSFGGVELSATETNSSPKSNITHTPSPSNQTRRVEDEAPVEVVVHAI